MNEALQAMQANLNKFIQDATGAITSLATQNKVQAQQIADLQAKVNGSADDAAAIAAMTQMIHAADVAVTGVEDQADQPVADAATAAPES